MRHSVLLSGKSAAPTFFFTLLVLALFCELLLLVFVLVQDSLSASDNKMQEHALRGIGHGQRLPRGSVAEGSGQKSSLAPLRKVLRKTADYLQLSVEAPQWLA